MSKLEAQPRDTQGTEMHASNFDVRGLYADLPRQKAYTSDRGVSSADMKITNIYASTSSDSQLSSASASCGKVICDWRPDANSGSEKTRKWRNDASAQREKPADVDEQGQYKVKPGDTLWDISKRLATPKDGPAPSNMDIINKMEEIVKENKGRHRNLDCNPHLLRPGDTLKVPGEPQSGTTNGTDVESPSTKAPESGSMSTEQPGLGNIDKSEHPGLGNFQKHDHPDSGNMKSLPDDQTTNPKPAPDALGTNLILLGPNEEIDPAILRELEEKTRPEIIRKPIWQDAHTNPLYEQNNTCPTNPTSIWVTGPYKVELPDFIIEGLPIKEDWKLEDWILHQRRKP